MIAVSVWNGLPQNGRGPIRGYGAQGGLRAAIVQDDRADHMGHHRIGRSHPDRARQIPCQPCRIDFHIQGGDFYRFANGLLDTFPATGATGALLAPSQAGLSHSHSIAVTAF